jgi:hypothetical protein
MNQVAESLQNAAEHLKAVDTTNIGQPHKDVLQSILNILLEMIPAVLSIFHHVTGTVPAIPSSTIVVTPTMTKESTVVE